MDNTVEDQEVTYPNDLKLLNEARESLERLIDLLYDKQRDRYKPRDYKRIAGRAYLNLGKMKRKSRQEIRRGIKQQ